MSFYQKVDIQKKNIGKGKINCEKLNWEKRFKKDQIEQNKLYKGLK